MTEGKEYPILIVSVADFVRNLEKGRAQASSNAITELGHIKQILDAVLVAAIPIEPSDMEVLANRLAAIRANIPFCVEQDKEEIGTGVDTCERFLKAIAAAKSAPGTH